MKRIKIVKIQVNIGGKNLKCLAIQVKLAGYGSLGTASFKTSIEMLNNADVDLLELAEQEDGAPIDITLGYSNGESEKVFSGVYTVADWDYRAGTVTVEASDWGAPLMEAKMTMAGFKYKNQTVGQIVKQIAEKFGLGTSKIQDPGMKAGAEFKDSNALIPHPQPAWGILQNLAEQSGYEVRVTPDKDLYFGPLGQEGESHTFTWGQTPEDSPEHPLKDLRVRHSPRKHNNFVVRVVSYHPKKAEIVKEKVEYKPLGKKSVTGATGGKTWTSAGVLVASSSSNRINTDMNSGGSTSGGQKKPVYQVVRQGLTAEQAKALADGLAKDIAKREIRADGTCEGYPALKVHDKIQIKHGQFGYVDYENRSLTCVGVTHSWDMQSGFLTTFLALSTPEEISGGSGF